MTDSTVNPDLEALDRLAEGYHENARRKGFVDLHDRLEALAEKVAAEGDEELANYLRLVEAGNEIMLLTTELGEAHEQIRTSPFGINETYYFDAEGTPTLERFNEDGTPRKPEGYPSELADVLIRLGDTVGRRKVLLSAIAGEKAEYNASRAQRHGGKKF